MKETTNRNGVELINRGTFWMISKPIKNPPQSLRSFGRVADVYHTGKENYIKELWKKLYS